MLFFARAWQGAWWAEPERAAASLGLFAGHAADSCRIGDDFFAQLPHPRAPVRRGWQVARSPTGWPVMLHGVIDNPEDLARELGLTGPPERLYGAAVERWGVEADHHVIGEYAALVVLPGAGLRLARSAWAGNPLFYHHGPDGILVSSIPRPLFAAGLPRQLRRGVIESLAAMEAPPDHPILYEGLEQVAGGTVTLLSRHGTRVHRYYEAAAIPPVRLRRDRDYVEAAGAMLGEAAARLVRHARKPAVTLSGGLDSALACDELWRQLGPRSGLKAYTFEPIAQWDGRSAPHLFGSDRPHVERFLAAHPGLDHRFVDNRETDPFTQLPERLLASDGYPGGAAISFPHLGVSQAAVDDGCDWIFTGWLGNMTISNGAPWAPAEYFRRLRWGEGLRLAASRIGDARPLWRRFLAGGLMPNLPPALGGWIRQHLRPGEPRAFLANPYLSATGALAAKRADVSLTRGDIDYLHSRRRFAASLYRGYQTGGEMALGVEQVTGLRGRDIYSYRPLIELCLGMPTRQFVRRGEDRYLARRLALGRLPEAQRTEVRHGDHVADWHARMTPRLPALRAELASLAGHPDLSALLDIDAIRTDLDHWPDSAPSDIDTINRLRFHLPTMFVLRRYLDFVSGRNPA